MSSTSAAQKDRAIGVNTMHPHKVVNVKPIGHLRLAVDFADGLKGEVIIKESHLYGVFESLKDASVFEKVRCDHGFVEWSGEIDITPDAMYAEIKAHG